MSVLNFKYVVFSVSFIHSPIGSDYLYSLVLNVYREKMFIVQFVVKILETFTTD